MVVALFYFREWTFLKVYAIETSGTSAAIGWVVHSGDGPKLVRDSVKSCGISKPTAAYAHSKINIRAKLEREIITKYT